MGQPDARAKEPVSALLAGPYAHPFHPLLVTVPIGAWVASVVFDIASHVGGPEASLAIGATWLLAVGVLGALAAACVGFLDYLVIPTGNRAHRTVVQHMLVNLVVIVGFAVSFAWRLGQSDGPTPVGPLVLSVACLVLLSVSGTLGGRLAYRYGVRVAAEPVQAHGFEPLAEQARSSPSAPSAPRSKGA